MPENDGVRKVLHVLEHPSLHRHDDPPTIRLGRENDPVHMVYESHEFDWWHRDERTGDLFIGIMEWRWNEGTTTFTENDGAWYETTTTIIPRGLYAKVWVETVQPPPPPVPALPWTSAATIYESESALTSTWMDDLPGGQSPFGSAEPLLPRLEDLDRDASHLLAKAMDRLNSTEGVTDVPPLPRRTPQPIDENDIITDHDDSYVNVVDPEEEAGMRYRQAKQEHDEAVNGNSSPRSRFGKIFGGIIRPHRSVIEMDLREATHGDDGKEQPPLYEEILRGHTTENNPVPEPETTDDAASSTEEAEPEKPETDATKVDFTPLAMEGALPPPFSDEFPIIIPSQRGNTDAAHVNLSTK